MTAQIEARKGASGSLVLSKEVPGLTQKMSLDDVEWYGGQHLVCETIFDAAAKAIAEAMGWKWIGTEPFSGDKT